MLLAVGAFIISLIPGAILFFYLRGIRKEEKYQKDCWSMLGKGVLWE